MSTELSEKCNLSNGCSDIIFKFKAGTENEIRKIISFENKILTENEGMPVAIVKAALPFICTPLTHINNHLLVSRAFPEGLKVGTVIIQMMSNSPSWFQYFQKSYKPQFVDTNEVLDKQKHTKMGMACKENNYKQFLLLILVCKQV